MSSLVYIVEDEDNIREILVCTFEAFGYRVKSFPDAENLLADAIAETPDLILLDIMLPGRDGVTALRELKTAALTANIPVIMLTANSLETEKVVCFDAGADDYITKPFGVLELSARVRAAIRRKQKNETPARLLAYKDIEIDDEKRAVSVAGVPTELTLKEYTLLWYLIDNREKVLSRDDLLTAVWGYDFTGESRTLDMHIKTLRQKLGDTAENPKYIKTVRGVGYALI